MAGSKQRNTNAKSDDAAPLASAAGTLPPWAASTPDGCRIRVHAAPRATRTEICGEHGGALKVRLAAPPVDGKANAALCEWLAGALGVPRRDVTLASGASSREKTLSVVGVSARDAAERLGQPPV